MSPRNKIPRLCKCQITGGIFKPSRIPLKDLEKIEIFRDELETLRLCDAQGLTQQEAGEKMGISRGTVQRILSDARRKTAQALSDCKAIVLEEPICTTSKIKSSKEKNK